ncbi:MAG: hypothetical protein ABIQ55_05880 [Gemmatimonadaceae bacterium]
MNKTIKVFSVAVLCAILAACASLGKQTPLQNGEQTTVVVDNRAVLDMNIYVLRGGQRIRLGTANGLSRTTLKIPRGIVSGTMTVRFLADPIGSTKTPVSEEISVNEGDEVGLMIPPV